MNDKGRRDYTLNPTSRGPANGVQFTRAPYAYVTTEKFLFEFGFDSLRDLPDLEKLEDAGLLGTASRDEPGRAGLALESATGEALPDRASRLADLAGGVGVRAEEDEPEEDAA